MKYVIAVCISFVLVSCSKTKNIVVEADDFHGSVDKVTQIMVHDIFSPPVASRIYAYPNLAAYEIIAANNDNFISLKDQVNDLPIIEPAEDENVNLNLAALIAHMDISRQLVFSENLMITHRDSLYKKWQATNEEEFEASKSYALEVVNTMKDWIDKDNYKQTRTAPKFTVDYTDEARWQPTPPAYMEGIEPSWNKIRPLVMKSPDQFKPDSHPEYSMEKDSQFYKELEEVYNVINKITEEGDESEELQIAQFWDCNPYVSVTRGHLMFAKKKITPGAHWMGIAKIACRKSDFNFEETVYAMTKTSVAIFDGFISCWDEKYRSNLVRPETLINNHIDDSWEPILQTPPFPEYPSGHSVVSGAASVVLTSIFGDDFQFDDDTELPYGLPVRSFNSFEEAAQEAAISRLYGGIHYMAACVNGLEQGQALGSLVAENLNMRSNND